jgi:hypothetical protein
MMSLHIAWADQAQLTEHSTGLNLVASLRECVCRYAELPDSVRINALLMADSDVALPGRTSTRILEQPELDTLLRLLDPQPISTALVKALIARREAAGQPTT